MTTFFLIASALLFIVAFGIHIVALNDDPYNKPMYTSEPLLSILPWVSGFIMTVIPLTLLLDDLHWLAIFVGNAALVFLLGPILTKAVLVRFSSGKGFGYDMIYSFLGGVIALAIGLLAKSV